MIGYIETEGHGFKYLKNFPSVNCLFIMKLLTMLDFSAKKAKIVSSRRLFCLPQRSDPNPDHSQNRTFIYHDQEYRTEIFSHTSEKSHFVKFRFFSHLLPKPPTYFYVHLIDGAARIFPNSYAATGNRTHVSSVAHLLRDFNPGCFTD